MARDLAGLFKMECWQIRIHKPNWKIRAEAPIVTQGKDSGLRHDHGFHLKDRDIGSLQPRRG